MVLTLKSQVEVRVNQHRQQAAHVLCILSRYHFKFAPRQDGTRKDIHSGTMCYVACRANLPGNKVRDHRSADLAYRGVRWNIHT